ncbi:MAG: HEAT repeat domain-containing protein [Asgard group archaeon]|nr:HEAT repeat domain-containing protein [Asgard group archaeon]
MEQDSFGCVKLNKIDDIKKRLTTDKSSLEICADIWQLGNYGKEAYSATKKLIKILYTQPDWRVRSWIVWSLGRIGGKRSKRVLSKVSKKDDEEFIRDGAKIALDDLELRDKFLDEYENLPAKE